MLVREQPHFEPAQRAEEPFIPSRHPGGRLTDVLRSLAGLFVNPLHVGLPQHDRRMELALAGLLAVMLYISAIALLAAFILGHAAQGLDRDLNVSLTVEIESPTAENRLPGADDRAKRVMALLYKVQGVRKIRIIGDQEARSLIKPWLGAGAFLPDLPLPRLLDIELEKGEASTRHAIDKALEGLPGVTLNDHAVFLKELAEFSSALRGVAAAVVALAMLALFLAVFFAARSHFAINREMIEILHLMGSEDSSIAQHSGLAILRLLLLAAALALIFSFFTLFALIAAGGSIHFSLLPHFSIGFAGWAGLTGAWLVLFASAIVLGMLAAHLSVLRALRRVL